jgi:hypothetical protein
MLNLLIYSRKVVFLIGLSPVDATVIFLYICDEGWRRADVFPTCKLKLHESHEQMALIISHIHSLLPVHLDGKKHFKKVNSESCISHSSQDCTLPPLVFESLKREIHIIEP